jgi:hypothetical protein
MYARAERGKSRESCISRFERFTMQASARPLQILLVKGKRGKGKLFEEIAEALSKLDAFRQYEGESRYMHSSLSRAFKP